MSDTPTIEPVEITAGDTVTWKKSFGDYPASAGWSLTYALVNSDARIEIAAAASGDDHLVTLDTTTTGGFTAGSYKWQAYVTKGGERYTVGGGRLVIRPNFATQSTGYDDRSHAQKMLEAIEALLESRATKMQGSYSVRGRQLQYLSPAELIQWRDTFRAEVVRERRAARIKKGLGHAGIIKVRG